MSLVEEVTIDPIDTATCRLSTTVTADKEAWVFVNGVAVTQSYAYSGTALALTIPMRPAEPYSVELHILDSGETTESIYRTPDLRPSVYWTRSDGALKYKVYHRLPGATGAAIGSMTENGEDIQSFSPQSDMTVGWHEFMVSALNEYAQEGTTDYWTDSDNLLYDTPDAPSAISIAGELGVFTVTVEE